jgi:uncharacterized repeat protein (TIGR01451 family)
MGAKRLTLAVAACLCIALPTGSAARDSDLTGNLVAYRVVKTAAGGEDFLPADKAEPRDIIEYRLTYMNEGKDPVQNIHITDPIPSGTAYLEQSATKPAGSSVLFSIDGGKTFSAWPIYITRRHKDGTETKIQATPEMVTHIRWVLSETFQPDSKVTLSYRTQIK